MELLIGDPTKAKHKLGWVPTTKMDDPWNAEPDLAGHGVSSLIHSNNWGTNYVMWYPYRKDGADVADEQTIVARYNVRF